MISKPLKTLLTLASIYLLTKAVPTVPNYVVLDPLGEPANTRIDSWYIPDRGFYLT
jgi:hypothetical protein